MYKICGKRNRAIGEGVGQFRERVDRMKEKVSKKVLFLVFVHLYSLIVFVCLC